HLPLLGTGSPDAAGGLGALQWRPGRPGSWADPGRGPADDAHPDRAVCPVPALLHARHRHHRGRAVSEPRRSRAARIFDTEHPDWLTNPEVEVGTSWQGAT